MRVSVDRFSPAAFRVICAVAALSVFTPGSAVAAVDLAAFRQSVAETASSVDALSDFYRSRDFAPLWTTAADAARREAFFRPPAGVADHGLPPQRQEQIAPHAGPPNRTQSSLIHPGSLSERNDS